jgi:hypothetical protein
MCLYPDSRGREITLETNKKNSNGLTQSKPLQLMLMFFIILVILGCKLTGMQDSTLPSSPVKSPLPLITATKPGDAPPPLPGAATGAPSPQPVNSTKTTAIWEGGTESPNGPALSGTPQVRYWFSGDLCSCATFPAVAEASYGPGYLECKYAWSGEYIDDNAISFSITQYDFRADLENEFREHIGLSYDSAQDDQNSINAGSSPEHEQYVARNETNGFTYVTTGPGGGSSKTQTEIPMCGHGGGVIRAYEDFLVEIRLFACDLGEERQVYQNAIETLEDCSLGSIEKVMSSTP